MAAKQVHVMFLKYHNVCCIELATDMRILITAMLQDTNPLPHHDQLPAQPPVAAQPQVAAQPRPLPIPLRGPATLIDMSMNP